MLNCFVREEGQVGIPVVLIPESSFAKWLSSQTEQVQSWLKACHFQARPGAYSLLSDEKGTLTKVICCISDKKVLWDVGHLPMALPEGDYYFEAENDADYAISWGLGAYQFNRYKKPSRQPARLCLSGSIANHVLNIVTAIYQGRDWINTPTDDMGPTQFAEAAEAMARQCGAEFTQIIGEDLLKQNYASIYTVGRASDDPPRLLDMRWGDIQHPKITLVGKGVCFDSGGLDIKPAAYMQLMKKDMAGGAHVFALARMMMEAKLPIRLRVLVPLVENVISGNAYRPGDVINSRSGLTIEVGNTDCEGRVVMADALTEACREKPDLLIDMSTLTGAARVALGLDVPAVFSNHNEIVADIIKKAELQNDPVWRLPLFDGYREQIESTIADISNDSSQPYGGAITAGLFLKAFVSDDIPWLHFDMMAWNLKTRPGRPQGAEILALRGLFAYLSDSYR